MAGVYQDRDRGPGTGDQGPGPTAGVDCRHARYATIVLRSLVSRDLARRPPAGRRRPRSRDRVAGAGQGRLRRAGRARRPARPARRDERAAGVARSGAARRGGVLAPPSAWIRARQASVAPDDLRRLLALWSANLDDGLGHVGRRSRASSARSRRCACRSSPRARWPRRSSRAAEVAAALRPAARLLRPRARPAWLRRRRAAGCTRWRTPPTPSSSWRAAPQWAPANLGAPARRRARQDRVERRRLRLGRERSAGAGRCTPPCGAPDADTAAFEAWTARWVDDHKALWAGGPQVDPVALRPRRERQADAAQPARRCSRWSSRRRHRRESARRAALAALARMR